MISKEVYSDFKFRMKTITMYLFGSWAWFIFTVILLVMLCFYPFTRSIQSTRKLAKKCSEWMIRLTGLELVVEGEENLTDGSSILVANHASYADPMILAAALPANFAYVAKKELKYIPFAGYVLGKLGTHLVDRRDAKKGADDFKKIMKSSKENDSIIFFPEATFLREEGLLKFKKGAFLTAIRNQVPVVPVTINGSRTFLRSESWLPEKVQLKVTIHPSIPTDNTDYGIKEIMDETRQKMLSTLGEPDLSTKSFQ